jgi:hypothetical protein
MNGITNYVWKCDGDGGQRRAEEEQTPVKMKKWVETQAEKREKIQKGLPFSQPHHTISQP